jgi:uncharacterized repeat protein (TIGR01451 family)/LPXTG-motif cell wall-anchored protein
VLTTSGDRLVAQVGDSIDYLVVVTNTSDAAISELSVRDLVPPEITVEGVPIIDEVSAVSLGYGPNGEDIVWTIDSLAPGASVELPWTGRAIAAGDFKAANRVQAVVRLRTQTQTIGLTYLGRSEGEVVRDAHHQTIKKQVIRTRAVTKMVPASSAAAEAFAAPGTLPATGSNPSGLLAIGALMIAAGVILVRVPRAHVVAVLALGALVLGACVTDESSPSAAPLHFKRVPIGAEMRAGKVQDRVLGLRFHNPDASDGAVTTPEGSTPGTTGAADQLVPIEIPVQVMEVVDAPLPLEEVADKAGDNQVTYSWDADSGSITEATSTHLIVAGASIEVLLDIVLEDGAIHATARARNVSDDHRVHLTGNLLYDITSDGGPVAQFSSDDIDTVLEPGGEVSADFAHLLPTGTYFATAGFSAN